MLSAGGPGMPIDAYSVLKGRPVAARMGTGRSPHYHILVQAGAEDHRVAVSIRSQDGSEVEYLVDSDFRHPLCERLPGLRPGLHRIAPGPDGLGLDYVRGDLLSRQDMLALPATSPGPDNDLNEKLHRHVDRAFTERETTLYAFGEPWPVEPALPDRYFDFYPSRGIHEVHMNQGSPPPPMGDATFFASNGVGQDGALLLHFPRRLRWVALFLKFKSQSWRTDDATGHPLDAG